MLARTLADLTKQISRKLVLLLRGDTRRILEHSKPFAPTVMGP